MSHLPFQIKLDSFFKPALLLGITGFLDFFHRPVFYTYRLGNTKFRKLDLFPSSGGGKTPTQLDPLETANLHHWVSDIHHRQNLLESTALLLLHVHPLLVNVLVNKFPRRQILGNQSLLGHATMCFPCPR
jgi:hypothetical protein